MRVCLQWGRAFGERGWKAHHFWHPDERSPRLRWNPKSGLWQAARFPWAVQP